jgi:hypothetical protein
MKIIPPGATVGVLGSGQLGRMFAIAARRMGYRVHTLSPDDDTPTGQIADREVQAAYDDLDAVRDFARAVDVVTFEFENVSAAAAEAAAEHAPVRPGGQVLHTTQNRLREKGFLRQAGFPAAPFAAVRSAEELERAVAEIGTPAVLKTAGWGYDGKGQAKIAVPGDAAAAWASLATGEAILEAFVDFERDSRRAGGGGGALRRDVPHPGRPAAGQRAGAAAAQLRAPDLRRLRDEPVRAAAPRDLWPAAGIDRAAAAGGHGEPAGGSLEGRRAGLGRRLPVPRGQAPSLRQGPGAPRA